MPFMVEPERPQMTKRRMHIACWIPKATDTHSEWVILIVFSMAAMLMRTRLAVTFTRTLPFLSNRVRMFRLDSAASR